MTSPALAARPRFAARIASLSGSVARDILSRTQEHAIVSFAGGLPDPELWQDFTLPSVPPSAYQYGPSEGERTLREILSAQARQLGVDAALDRALITTGSQQGLDLAAKLFVEPGTPVIAEAPTYLAALQVFQLFQADVKALELGPSGVDPEKLDAMLRETKAPLVYLNPTYQNPSGTCYPEERRRQIAEVLDARDAVLLEDDPYRDLWYEAKPPKPICAFLRRAPWIYLSSVSKTLLPGLRIGAAHCSAELYAPLLKLKQAADLHTNRPAQFIAASLLADKRGHARRLESLRCRYRTKRDLIAQALRRHFPDGAKWESPRGGMFFWIKLDQPVDLGRALESSLARGAAFMPGDPFFPGLGRGRFLRINFTSPAIEAIESGIATIADCLSEASRSPARNSA